MIRKRHHYYGVNLNPWPLIISMGVFNILFRFTIIIKSAFKDSIILRITVLVLCAAGWWAMYRGELNLEGSLSINIERRIKMGMILFIASEIFFFFSFFWSYFHFFLAPCIEIRSVWPPKFVETFEFLNVPLVNTGILITSGATVTVSHYFLMKENLKKRKIFLRLTWILGVAFTIFQVQEYQSSFFGLADRVYGTSFFMLTGFHGIHVLIGTIFLIVIFLKIFKISSFKRESVGFDLAAWYWHFVDVIWIFLYFLLYYLNRI